MMPMKGKHKKITWCSWIRAS